MGSRQRRGIHRLQKIQADFLVGNNLLNQRFSAAAANTVWVFIYYLYIWYKRWFGCIWAAILDVFNRKIGWMVQWMYKFEP